MSFAGWRKYYHEWEYCALHKFGRNASLILLASIATHRLAVMTWFLFAKFCNEEEKRRINSLNAVTRPPFIGSRIPFLFHWRRQHRSYKQRATILNYISHFIIIIIFLSILLINSHNAFENSHYFYENVIMAVTSAVHMLRRWFCIMLKRPQPQQDTYVSQIAN